MFSLDVLTHLIPTYQIVGRFGVDILAFFYKTIDSVTAEGVRLFNQRDPTQPFNLETVLRQSPLSYVPRTALRDSILVILLRGEFLSADKLAVSQMRRDADQWSVDLEITHFENLDGEPAPRDLCLALSIDMGNDPVPSLVLNFKGHWSDFQGNVTPLPDPVAPSHVIKFTG